MVMRWQVPVILFIFFINTVYAETPVAWDSPPSHENELHYTRVENDTGSSLSLLLEKWVKDTSSHREEVRAGLEQLPNFLSMSGQKRRQLTRLALKQLKPALKLTFASCGEKPINLKIDKSPLGALELLFRPKIEENRWEPPQFLHMAFRPLFVDSSVIILEFPLTREELKAGSRERKFYLIRLIQDPHIQIEYRKLSSFKDTLVVSPATNLEQSHTLNCSEDTSINEYLGAQLDPNDRLEWKTEDWEHGPYIKSQPTYISPNLQKAVNLYSAYLGRKNDIFSPENTAFLPSATKTQNNPQEQKDKTPSYFRSFHPASKPLSIWVTSRLSEKDRELLTPELEKLEPNYTALILTRVDSKDFSELDRIIYVSGTDKKSNEPSMFILQNKSTYKDLDFNFTAPFHRLTKDKYMGTIVNLEETPPLKTGVMEISAYTAIQQNRFKNKKPVRKLKSYPKVKSFLERWPLVPNIAKAFSNLQIVHDSSVTEENGALAVAHSVEYYCSSSNGGLPEEICKSIVESVVGRKWIVTDLPIKIFDKHYPELYIHEIVHQVDPTSQLWQEEGNATIMNTNLVHHFQEQWPQIYETEKQGKDYKNKFQKALDSIPEGTLSLTGLTEEEARNIVQKEFDKKYFNSEHISLLQDRWVYLNSPNERMAHAFQVAYLRDVENLTFKETMVRMKRMRGMHSQTENFEFEEREFKRLYDEPDLNKTISTIRKNAPKLLEPPKRPSLADLKRALNPDKENENP